MLNPRLQNVRNTWNTWKAPGSTLGTNFDYTKEAYAVFKYLSL